MSLIGLALAGATLVAPAQEAVLLDQVFQLHYNRWQFNQEAASASTSATYGFQAQMPLVEDRLGTLGLAGAVDYAHGSGDQPSTLGLNNYGVRATLFPYRPFHLSLDYSHSQSPELAGGERAHTDVYGAALVYRGQTVQDLQVTFREGRSSQGPATNVWSQETATATQQFATTRATVSATHQAFSGSGGFASFQNNYLYGTTDTRFSPTWSLNTNLAASAQAGSSSVGLAGGLSGSFGRYTSISTLVVDEHTQSGSRVTSALTAQSLVFTTERRSIFGSLALSTQSAAGDAQGSSQASASLGLAYSLTPNWRVLADVAESRASQTLSTGTTGESASGSRRSWHVGVADGGTVPDLVKHALFFYSEQNFLRRIQEDYAPGYVPSELAQEIQRRRRYQEGAFNFTADLSHTQADGGGKLDWLRATGALKLAEGLRVFTMGDLRRDNGLAQVGQRLEEKNLSLNVSEVFRGSSLAGSMGYAHSEQGALPSAGNGSSSGTPGPTKSASRFYGLTLNSGLLGVPYGVYWSRFITSQGPASTVVSASTDLEVGNLGIRLGFQMVRRDDGNHFNQITLDLLRVFDTIALYGFGRR